MSIVREVYNYTCSDVPLTSVKREIQNCVLVTAIKGYIDVGERKGGGDVDVGKKGDRTMYL